MHGGTFFSPKITVKQLFSLEWCLGALHSAIHRNNPCFQDASSQLWETKAVGRGTLYKISKCGLEADHTRLQDVEGES